MAIVLWISAAANVLLFIAIVRTALARSRAWKWADQRVREARNDTAQFRKDLDQLFADYCEFAGAVSTSLEAIREDINRNYHHIHDGHVLDQIAYQLRCEIKGRRNVVYGVKLDEHISDRVRALGGDASANGTMTLGQMLVFGWRLHTASRERAEELAPMVSQPCGRSDHTVWLSKVLAIYERMCDHDKDLAVKRLSAVVEAWRFAPGNFVPRYIEDVH